METAAIENPAPAMKAVLPWKVARASFWVALLVAMNLALLFAIGWLPRPNRGWIEFRDLLLCGISFGQFGLAVFVMSFGHLRAPQRHLLCSVFVMLSILMIPRGWFFSETMAAVVQIYYFIALWFGYLALVWVRWIWRLEFGFGRLGEVLPARPMQFRLYSIGILSGMVAIPFGMVRLMMSIAEENTRFPIDYVSLIGFPFLVLSVILLAVVPFVFSILRQRNTLVWSAGAILWGAAPAVLIWNYINPQIMTVYEVFWGTMVVNLLLMRLIGLRWLPVAQRVETADLL